MGPGAGAAVTNWLRGRKLTKKLPLLAIVIVCVCWGDLASRARGVAIFWASMCIGEMMAKEDERRGPLFKETPQ